MRGKAANICHSISSRTASAAKATHTNCFNYNKFVWIYINLSWVQARALREKGLPLRLKSRLVQIPKRATLLAIRNSGLVVLKTSYIFSQYSLGKYSLTPRVTVTIHVVHPQLKNMASSAALHSFGHHSSGQRLGSRILVRWHDEPRSGQDYCNCCWPLGRCDSMILRIRLPTAKWVVSGTPRLTHNC